MHRINPRSSEGLKANARRLRKNAPIPERILWNLLRGRQLAGYKFRRQQIVGPYIADYYCERARLVLELDGRSHDGRIAADVARDSYMVSRGIKVIRILNDDLLHNRAAVGEFIHRILDEQASRLGRRTASLHPNPLPMGEGLGEGQSLPFPLGEGRGKGRA